MAKVTLVFSDNPDGSVDLIPTLDPPMPEILPFALWTAAQKLSAEAIMFARSRCEGGLDDLVEAARKAGAL